MKETHLASIFSRARGQVHGGLGRLLTMVAMLGVTSISVAGERSSTAATTRGIAAGSPQSGVAEDAKLIAAAKSNVPSPTVTGPVKGGQRRMAFNPVPSGVLERYGYLQEEYFIAGAATAYSFKSPPASDGKWAVAPTTSAPYETRILVRRPSDRAKFNGAVVVEWLNVSIGQDGDPDWGYAHDELMRSGYAWVGVSAQRVGVDGSGRKLSIPVIVATPLKEWDAERYGPLHHPGDQYSYDIFSQAGMALARPTAVKPLGELKPRLLIAAGQSQSAGRLAAYANAIQPVAKVYGAFLIHSRGASAAPLNADASGAAPKVVFIRDDLNAPVMQIEAENDMFGLRFYSARQPDTKMLVTWEMAGTAHADQCTIDYGRRSNGVWNSNPAIDRLLEGLSGRINNGPQRYIVRKSIDALNTWGRGGPTAAHGRPFEITGGSAIARDASGNAVGGVRTPQVDVPTEKVTGVSGISDQAEGGIFWILGSSTRFPPEKLAALYRDHQDYVDKVVAAARRAVSAGFLLPADEAEIVRQAQDAKVPK